MRSAKKLLLVSVWRSLAQSAEGLPIGSLTEDPINLSIVSLY